MGLVDRQVVDLVGEFRGERRVAARFIVVPYDIPRGCAATYFPEANVLVPVDDFADGSRTPASKSVVIRVVPASSPESNESSSREGSIVLHKEAVRLANINGPAVL